MVNVIFLGANGCLSALLIPYGMIVLGGSKQTGLLMSALGVGFLLGAPLVRTLSDRIPPGFALAGALTVTGVGYGLLFTAPVAAVCLAGRRADRRGRFGCAGHRPLRAGCERAVAGWKAWHM